MRSDARISDFRTGLQTTSVAQQKGAAGFQTFYDGRVDKGSCQRRPGRVVVARQAPTVYCGDFDGTNDQLSSPASDSRVWPLGLRFSVEALVSAAA